MSPTQACVLRRNAHLETEAAARSGDELRLRRALSVETQLVATLFGVPNTQTADPANLGALHLHHLR